MELRPYNPSDLNQQWRFRKDVEYTGELEGIYELLNLAVSS